MKKIINNTVFIIIGALISSTYFITMSKNEEQKNMELVKNSFDIFKSDDLEKAAAEYHSKDYIQYSDGKTLNYDELLKHVKHVKESLASPVEITYDHIIADGDKVCTVHNAKATKKDGNNVHIKVIALHQIKDGKINLTDELTHVVEGTKEDEDLGSTY